MRTRPQFFDSVRAASENLWEQIERNEELGGAWWLLFRQVQNPRHVLSELLQNADDAGATAASVSIENGWFIFRHDGHDFTEGEFRSLCRFGFSNKRRLLTIGFRGIGFKSVFSLGRAAEVLTETIAIRFVRERFTQPEWISTDECSKLTTVRVRIESPEKQQAIQTQIDGWASSAVPLLFFQSIRTLRLADKEVRVEKIGPGPCGNSDEVRLSGLDGNVLVFRSPPEPFPPPSLDEIRAERNEEIDLPPCEVVIVLGAAEQQRLYCVLPTEVTVELPFSCHAPFVQDPARTGVKDPSISPTNAWLLGRIGKLAAESVLKWLRRDDLVSAERAKAYRLLPELTPLNIGLLSGTVTQRVLDAFRARIGPEKVLLCEGGELNSRHHVARLPSAAIHAWGAQLARALFSPVKASVLALEVPAGSRSRLEAWQLLDAASFGSLFDELADESKPLPPRPERLEALAEFWAFLQQHLPAHLIWLDWWERAAIVPLAGRGRLGRAKDTLPTRTRPADCAPDDWQFMLDRAAFLDERWRDLMDVIRDDPHKAQRQIADQLGRPLEVKALAGILDGFRKTKLDQGLRLDQAFAHVAKRVYTESPDTAEAVKLTQLAARLNATFAASVPIKFLCVDGQWRERSNDLVINTDLDLALLLPEHWLRSHLVSPEYERGLSPSEIAGWRGWALKPDKCGLTAFALSVRVESTRTALDPEFFRARGAPMPSVGARAKKFVLTDWNWAPEIWDHWSQLERASGGSAWRDVGWAVVRSWSDLLDKRAKVEIHEHGYKHEYRVSVAAPATWLHEIRNRPCVLDSRGKGRVPAELLRRTLDTLPLLDVEDFVHDRWDLTESQRALEVLGVRSQATDASRLLDRVRALAQSPDPPMGPLRDLYRAIEKVLPRLPAERARTLGGIFAMEYLIRTESAWERSGFCFRDNPGRIPGVSVLHPDIRDVSGLWESLKIASQPSASDALRWFGSLSCDAPLSDPVRNAARKVLASYPQDAWNCEKRWLNLQGRLMPTSDIRWGSLDGRSIPGLFALVRKETADFSMLDPARIHSLTTDVPRFLDNAIERRILGYVPVSGMFVGEQLWVQALGEVLSRMKDGEADEAAVQGDQRSGARLARTKWVSVEGVRVQPYLDRVPAGAQAELTIAWIGEQLYVRGDSMRGYKQVVQELSKCFVSQQALSAIRDCVGRDPQWIHAYTAEYLDLGTHPPLDPAPESPRPTVPEETRNEQSVFPGDGTSQLASAESPVEAMPPSGQEEPYAKVDETTPPRKPSAPKDLSKLDRLKNFLAARGFHWNDDQGIFIHPDGAVVRRSDGVFPWELATADWANPFWLAGSSLSDRNGIEIPAEVWNAAKRCDAVLLEPEDDGCREHHFNTIRAQVDALDLELYPATYRIKVAGE